MNLILALFWFLLGVALLLPWLDPDGPMPNTIISPVVGVPLAFLLCAYNLVRWWSSRMASVERRALQEALEKQRQEMHRTPDRPYRPPDPNFDFSERAPQ